VKHLKGGLHGGIEFEDLTPGGLEEQGSPLKRRMRMDSATKASSSMFPDS
jgi:hypothetical protein